MSDPTRLKYRSHDEVPPTADLLAQVTRDWHLVLEFPAGYDSRLIETVIDRVAREAPEDYTVFDAGAFRDMTCASIMQLVKRSAVIEMEEYLMRAAQHFRRTATELALALAAHHHIAPEQLWEECHRLESHSAEWKLIVHGQHCCFVHRQTGQTVEVSMWFGTEFGVLDPYFFHDYMKTTPGLEPPAELRNGFHDTCRAMEILEERGKLVRITGIFESVGVTASAETSEG